MDEYVFKCLVDACKSVPEKTSYLEILNYSDPKYNKIEEHSLSHDGHLAFDDFQNFVRVRGAFEQPKLPDGVKLVSGIRLILQLDAQHPETFTPNYISFTPDVYQSMVRELRLPFRSLESQSAVGPFFWSGMEQDCEDPVLQVVFRKSDVRKKGFTRGWELMLSHSFATGITAGYAKGTKSSDLGASIKHLRECAAQIMHPLLLPVIILSHDLSAKNDAKQRETREWLRHLEVAISNRDEVAENELYLRGSITDLDQINRDLVECHSQTLWKRPQAYLELIQTLTQALDRFWDKAKDDPKYGGNAGEVGKVHRNMLSRMEFYKSKLKCIENYQSTTLERLNIQRAALYNIIAQKEAKLNLVIATEQRKLAHASKRDSDSMKTLSLLGALFLPATLLSSVFSMTFFNFQTGSDPIVSSLLWVYFIIAVPLTVLVLAVWRWWDKRLEAAYALEDGDIEKQLEVMENEIIKKMRTRTQSKKKTTWDVGSKTE